MTNVSDENIRVAAYYIWEQAGCPEGKEKDCWIRACEQLFAAKPSKKAPAKAVAKSATKVAAKPAVKVAAKPAAKVAVKPVAKPTVSATPFYGVKKK